MIKGSSIRQSATVGYQMMYVTVRIEENGNLLGFVRVALSIEQIDANIQSVQVNQDTWHRVRIGPIHKMATLTATLKRLKEHNIAVIIVKSKT